MAAIKVITDSACDLPADIVQAHDIGIVALDVRLGQWGPDQLNHIEPAEFWRRCASTTALPETSSPSPGAFAHSFSQAAADGSAVVCLTLSSALSSTYQAACAGAQQVRDQADVRVVDTRSVSLGQGLVVLETVQAAVASHDPDVTEAAARRAVADVHVFCTLDTMQNVRKGGRIGAARALLGSLLAVKPVIEIRDGAVQPESQPRTRRRSLEYLANLVRRAGPLQALGVAHAAAPDLEVFLEMLAGTFPRPQILVNYLGPVIGAHAGPGCVGVCFRPARLIPPA
jgi:DegV family protein with EDD domain